MKFKYRVKHNGVVYPAGADVPVEGVPVETPEVKPEVVPEEEAPKAAKKVVNTKATPKRKAKK